MQAEVLDALYEQINNDTRIKSSTSHVWKSEYLDQVSGQIKNCAGTALSTFARY